ncbi:MAG TPA: hypothetical protein VN924_31975 [Bryobacteraceae bacterium]|nr:hypothetical protein [Bryobacteraceae bacterium]
MCRHFRTSQSGSTMIEFCLSAVLWTTVLMGLCTVGMNLIRALQVEQVCRDAGRMYSAGLDFTQAGNQNLLIMVATGLNVTTSGGNGVFVFSTVEYIDTPQCSSCANLGQYVFIQRVVVGNASLLTSPFGTPAAGIIGASGNISSSNYLSNASARATGFGSVVALTGGQVAYLTETYFSSPDFAWGSYMSGAGIYERKIF